MPSPAGSPAGDDRRGSGPLRRLGLGFRWVVAVGILALCATVCLIAILRWVPPPTSAFMVRERLVGPEPVRYTWVSSEAIAPDMALAVVASEDQRFPDHPGFDLDQIRIALSTPGGPTRGASTISQQVAKNLFLWPGGGYARKGLEACLTVWIEALWPKDRILEVYLNLAEFGPGVFGVGAASTEFFGKEPASLNSVEASRLAAVLPSPKRMSAARPSPYVLERSATIRTHMRNLGGNAYLSGIWP